MSDNKNRSKGISEKKDECVKEFIVSDKFKIMMKDAFSATKSVLNKRAKNLENWTENDEEEFEKIFGVSGDTMVTYTFSAKNTGGLLLGEVDARTFMREGVNRLITICDRISVESRVCQNGVNLYGNFINNTHISPGSARVTRDLTINLSPKE